MEFVFLSGSESPDSTQHRQIRTPMEVARASPNVSPNVILGCESVRSNLCLDGCGLGANVETGASVPSYSGGLAAGWWFSCPGMEGAVACWG